MKRQKTSADRNSSAHNEGFRLIISERAFTALLKAILLLTLLLPSSQVVTNKTQRPIPALSSQEYLFHSF